MWSLTEALALIKDDGLLMSKATGAMAKVIVDRMLSSGYSRSDDSMKLTEKTLGEEVLYIMQEALQESV